MNPDKILLPVKSIINARDLGGYEVAGGLHVKHNMLIRTAHLADATDKDLQYLAKLNIAKVIDLRQEREKLGKEDRMIPGAEYVCVPIDAGGRTAAQASEEEREKLIGKKKFDIRKFIMVAAFNEMAQKIGTEMYPTLLFYSECQQQFALLFQQILNTENGAILFHCTQGKDRTGITSALLLAALGASRETIVADFDFTNQIYAKDVRKFPRRVRFMGGKEKEIATVKAFIGANTENFIKALDTIDERYGSMEAYLKGPMKLTDADLQTLRERYLE